MTARILYTDRFFSKVEKTSSCWLWTASSDGYGYGMFNVGGRSRRAHRISYEIAHGPVPDGTVFLHECDNPPCVNPAHLRIGTRAENNADRDAKGRHVALRGEAHGRALLTEDQVRAIRSAPREYGSALGLAKRFGVSISTIYQLRSTSRNWAGIR